MEQDSKRAILAVILSGIVLFGWQYLFPTPTVSVPVKKAETTVQSNGSTTSSVNTVKVEASNTNTDTTQVETVSLISGDYTYTIDNHLKVVETKAINTDNLYTKHFEAISSELFIEIRGNEFKPFFILTKIAENKYSLKTTDDLIAGSVSLDDKGMLDVRLSSQVEFNYKFVMNSKKVELNMQDYNQFIFLSKDLETIAVGNDEAYDASITSWFGLDFHHYFTGIVFSEPSLYKIRSLEVKDQDDEVVAGKLIVRSIKKVRDLNYKNIFLLKDYDTLIDLGHKLELAVDFGIMSIIAVPILRGLQFFYTIFPNWGIAIILLTILIRMLTFPLQYKSFKSMKKMQVIQPELKELKEKFKDNPQKMQQETMALFKKAGANPLGGCLPLLLQMPIFFAFYRVLYSAVELVDAEFIFWIVDLSEKDPYYVLPILMSVAMFLNMKLTPSASADPAQQKIMMFMPLFFGFIMKDLPAGLTLYIFISTIMGMLQQLFVYKRVS